MGELELAGILEFCLDSEERNILKLGHWLLKGVQMVTIWFVFFRSNKCQPTASSKHAHLNNLRKKNEKTTDCIIQK